MKSLQPLIRLCVLVFFISGIFQTAQGQTIDDESKTILEQFEKKYSSFETASFSMKMMMSINDEVETKQVKIDFNHQYMKAEHDEALVVSDGKEDVTFIKELELTDTDDHDIGIRLFWMFKMPDFCREFCNVTYGTTDEIVSSQIHLLNVEILDDNSSIIEAKYYLNKDNLEIQKIIIYFDEDKTDHSVITITDYQMNPTFPDDYFEIKN